MSVISRYNPFHPNVAEDRSMTFGEGRYVLQCSITLGSSDNVRDHLHRIGFTNCNQGALRVRCWEQICQGLVADATERPRWMDEAGKIIFTEFVRDPQVGISTPEAQLIGPTASENSRLLSGDGSLGYLKLEGMHAGVPGDLSNWIGGHQDCPSCRAATAQVYESVYLNTQLRYRSLEHSWMDRTVENLTDMMQEFILPFQEFWDGYIFGDNPQTLRMKWNMCFASLDRFVQWGEKLLLTILGAEVALKVFFISCRFIGFKGVDGYLNQVDQQIENWMNLWAIPILTWEFLRKVGMKELKLLTILFGAGFSIALFRQRAHML